jgi:HSP20 family molecular chaperone IbpA
MPRLSLFNSPFMLGFDGLERLMDGVVKNAGDSFPPYDIEHRGEHKIRITLALAGFSIDDLTVTIEQSQLIIRGQQGENEKSSTYLHRGIAARQFQRKFVLADGMDAVDAYLENGLLHIDLERPQPDESVRTIAIR